MSEAPEPIESSITPLITALTTGGRVFGSIMGRVKATGAIDQIPREGPVILAANHASNLDAVAIGSWLMPKLGRRIHWLGKKELFAWPIIGWAAANGGVHPVDRGAADIEAFRLAVRILDDGQILFVFPEGTEGGFIGTLFMVQLSRLGDQALLIHLVILHNGAKMDELSLPFQHRAYLSCLRSW